MALIGADDGVTAAVTAAVVMVNFADCWSPTTEAIAKIMGSGAGGPFTLGEGASKWYDGASKVQQAQQSLQELTDGLPSEGWSGSDRDAFNTEISNLLAEIGDSHNYAMAVAITLTALAVPIGSWPVVCDGIGVVEAANAAAFYAAAASIVGDLGVSESLYAEGEAVTFTCLSIMEASQAILIAAMAAGTAAVAISDASDIGSQSGHGDTGVAGEFGKATVDSLPQVGMAFLLAHSGKDDEGGEGDGEGEGAGDGAGDGDTEVEPPPDVPGGSDEGGEDAGTETTGDDGDGDAHVDPPPDIPGGSGEHEGEGEGDGDGSGDDEGEHPVLDALKDKIKEKVSEPVTSGLSHLINAGASSVDPGWNSPDAPKPSDENWGSG